MGDVGGYGYKGTLQLTLEQCSQQCNTEQKCLSFEHAPFSCHLNEIANPTATGVAWVDFCIKLGIRNNLKNA